MEVISLVLNAPASCTGLFAVILSMPKSIRVRKDPLAVIASVRSFWWTFGYLKNARAMTVGNIIILGPRLLENDLEHELVHVSQYRKYPLIFPFLYYYDLAKQGYRKNRFEDEAYRLSESTFEGRSNG